MRCSAARLLHAASGAHAAHLADAEKEAKAAKAAAQKEKELGNECYKARARGACLYTLGNACSRPLFFCAVQAV